jgi:hypothetical protein
VRDSGGVACRSRAEVDHAMDKYPVVARESCIEARRRLLAK